ncbi:ankyrin repeat domain-containing protein 35 isoform X2 [Rhinatrema bivittatum]|uniref:ankyrin repeat domain-containing protein 35 isoform X2 n=1 Tax=Rhinatrema bivittatum TaxID=194408 RepID=UPI001129F568|nr:ankyrin repeat domain-containing protein 35 isoform X2 [Rhinatrema bivittatum]
MLKPHQGNVVCYLFNYILCFCTKCISYSSNHETAEVSPGLRPGGAARKTCEEDWQSLPHEEWRWRYEEEHKKVLHLQGELARKTQRLEAFAAECGTEKERGRAQIPEIRGSQQRATQDQPGTAEGKASCHSSSSDENNFLDLLMKQEQTLKEKRRGEKSDRGPLWENEFGKEGFEEETRKLEKRYQEEIEQLQSEVATAREGMESARRRTEELEGHLENMRVVISQFDKRKRTHSSMMEELQDQIAEITSENQKLRALVKKLLGDTEGEDKINEIVCGSISMMEPGDAQTILDSAIKELKQLLVQMRVEYANIQRGKQVLLKRQIEEAAKSQPQPELEIMIREDFERSATFFKKTVADVEQLLTDLEQKNTSLQEKSKQLQEVTDVSQNEEPDREHASEVFVHSVVSEMQETEEQLGKTQKKQQKEVKGASQENAVLKDVRKLLQTCAPSVQDDASISQWPGIIQQEDRSIGETQPLVGTEPESLLRNSCIETKDMVGRKTAELEKEVHNLRLSHASLLTELNNTGKERDKLQEDLEALQQSLETDFLPKKEMQSLIEDLEKNFLLLSEELSSEQEATKKLRSRLEAQRNDILMLRESFPKEIMREENCKEEGLFSTDVLEELYWNIGTLVRKHDEAVQQKLKVEKENQSLKDDQSQSVSLKDHNDLQRCMTNQIETQGNKIQELSWNLSKAIEDVEKLEAELKSQKTNSIPRGEYLQQVTALEKDLTETKERLESAKVTVAEKCQEIIMLKHQLDQATEEIKERTSREKKCLQQHEKVISSLEKEIQKLKDDRTECISILDHNALQTAMTHKIDTQAVEIQELMHQLSKAMENVQELQKELITQKTNSVPNETCQQQVTALGKDLTDVKKLESVNVVEGKSQDATKLDKASEMTKEITSREKNCFQQHEKNISSLEKEIQTLKDDHIECVSIQDHNALQISMSHIIEIQANEIQELERKLTEALNDVQELQKELLSQNINSVPNEKSQQVITLERNPTEIRERIQSGTALLDEGRQEMTLMHPLSQVTEDDREQKSMVEDAVQYPKEITTSLEVENQKPTDGLTRSDIQATVIHIVDRQTTETEQLKQQQQLSESMVNIKETQTDPLWQKTNSVPCGEHLQHVTALEHALTEVTDELESDKAKLDEQRQEIMMLTRQLDQAASEVEELKSRKKNGLQAYKSSFIFQAPTPRDDAKTRALHGEVVGPEMERHEHQIKEAMLEQLQTMMVGQCDEADDLSFKCQDRECKISELLEHLQKCAEEVMDLRSINTAFQQRLEENQKQHEKVVSLYRAHLLNAAQGFMDGDVYSALSRILQIQNQMLW